MDMNNGCTKTATTIVVLGPLAAFTHTVNNAQVSFNSISTGTNSNTNYFWNFGDGNSSTLQNPTHTYISGGAHLVTLQVMNNGTLCTGSIIQSINVTGLPCTSNSNFSMVPTGTAQIWNATPNYPWNVSSARWDWGDGYSSNTLYTSHQYSAAGMYNICLSVTVSCGDTSTTCTSYSVYRTSEEAMILEVNVVEPELITGINSLDSNEPMNWNIIPNPNSGEFKLNLNSTEAVRVVISDLAGRIVYNQFFEAHADPSVMAKNLLPGMYLVTLETNTQKNTKRMIINH
jgi:PKD repeat protein